MKKFKFTLQALLNVKISQEKKKTGELSDQNRVIQKLESQLQALYERLNASTDEYRSKMEQGGMSAGDVSSYSAGIRAIHDRILEQQDKIKRAAAVKEKLMKELTALMGERKMLENLSEKQYQEYLEEVRKEEAKVIDDFMSSKIIGENQDG